MSHPSYLKMIQKAIIASKDSGKGVSRTIIANYVENNYDGLASGSRFQAAIIKGLQQGIDNKLFQFGDKRYKGDKTRYKLCGNTKKNDTKKTKNSSTITVSTDSDQESEQQEPVKPVKKKQSKRILRKRKRSKKEESSDEEDEDEDDENTDDSSDGSSDSDIEDTKPVKQKKKRKKIMRRNKKKKVTKKKGSNAGIKRPNRKKWETVTCSDCNKDFKLSRTNYALIIEEGASEPYCKQCMASFGCTSCEASGDANKWRYNYCGRCAASICYVCRKKDGGLCWQCADKYRRQGYRVGTDPSPEVVFPCHPTVGPIPQKELFPELFENNNS